MANTGITVDDDLLEEFDRLILRKKADGDLPMDTSRSNVIEDLIQEWVEENRQGNPNPPTVAIAN